MGIDANSKMAFVTGANPSIGREITVALRAQGVKRLYMRTQKEL